VTGFTGVMWSRIVDDGEAASAGGGVGAEAGEVSAGVTGVVGVGVDEAVDVGVDAAVVVGPLICGDGACGTGCKLPGVRQSPVGCRCARHLRSESRRLPWTLFQMHDWKYMRTA